MKTNIIVHRAIGTINQQMASNYTFYCRRKDSKTFDFQVSTIIQIEYRKAQQALRGALRNPKLVHRKTSDRDFMLEGVWTRLATYRIELAP